MAGDRCVACRKTSDIGAAGSEFAVARTTTGYVYLAECQYHRGYVDFIAKDCVRELHDLGPTRRAQHLEEMALVAEAVARAFRPVKLNVEALGNSVPHLHWHLIPRHADDPRPGGPVWEDPEFLAALRSGAARPTPDELTTRRAALLHALDDLGLPLERRYPDD
jgi:diadenosine tetraphosphate (Ap4A) HIT family hydrolase